MVKGATVDIEIEIILDSTPNVLQVIIEEIYLKLEIKARAFQFWSHIDNEVTIDVANSRSTVNCNVYDMAASDYFMPTKSSCSLSKQFTE